VREGDIIEYTVTIAHTGGVTPTGVVVTDNLADVLDDAVLDSTITPSTGSAELVGTDLVWTVGAFTGTQTLTYEVVVGANLDAVLTNVITPPPGSTCVGTCTTTHTTARWDVSKSADPPSGSMVAVGSVVTYTLTAANSGDVPVTDAVVIDDASGVLNNATIVGPLDPSLAFDSATNKLTWAVPTLAVGGAPVSVSYSVRVNDNAFGVDLTNLVTPGSPGGQCLPTEGEVNPCTTTHRVPFIDIVMTKSHEAIPEGAVEANHGDPVNYILTVTNSGEDPAHGVFIVDELPPSLDLVDSSVVLPGGWTATIASGVLTLTYAGVLEPGQSAEIDYTTLVGDVPRESPTGAYVPIDNTACAYSDEDSAGTNNCATDRVEAKSVAIDVAPMCLNDAPYLEYQVTPINLTDTPYIALIWWTAEAFAAHDPSIAATDTAAILADGAAKVDTVPVPAGWSPGEAISGRQLWPGAAVDAAGEATAWPGWTELPDGTWKLDPSAPFYTLRGETVVEVRINPSTDAAISYPPATPDCSAQPPDQPAPSPTVGPAKAGGSQPRVLAWTGADIAAALAIAAALVLGGVFLVIRRRKLNGDH
jgi:uncharacterized repeat protein (TIGR01451 family)